MNTTRVADSARAWISAPSIRSASPIAPCGVAYAAFSDHTTSSAVAGVPSEKRRPARSVTSSVVPVAVTRSASHGSGRSVCGFTRTSRPSASRLTRWVGKRCVAKRLKVVGVARTVAVRVPPAFAPVGASAGKTGARAVRV